MAAQTKYNQETSLRAHASKTSTQNLLFRWLQLREVLAGHVHLDGASDLLRPWVLPDDVDAELRLPRRRYLGRRHRAKRRKGPRRSSPRHTKILYSVLMIHRHTRGGCFCVGARGYFHQDSDIHSPLFTILHVVLIMFHYWQYWFGGVGLAFSISTR